MTSTGASGSPPFITGITPSSITANAGNTAAFTVAATGDPATYYWYKATFTSTNLISTATTATLTLTNVVAANAASYFVVLSNATPPVATSDKVTLTVVDPFIVAQPISQTWLVGGTVSFAVNVLGTQPISYQWYVKPTADTDFTGRTPLSNGGNIAGANTNVLTLANLAYADATNLFVVVNNSAGSVTSSVVTLTVASAASLAYWNFNGTPNTTNPAPYYGFGTAALVNCTGFTNMQYTSGLDDNPPGGTAIANAWGTSTYPTNGNAANNKTTGVRFNTSTVGAKNIAVTFDTKATTTSSKYERLQFTTNGTDWVDYPTSVSFSGASFYESRAFDLSGYPGVANNANFGVRIVSEFESTAKYGATNNAQYIGITAGYGTGGTLTYDIVKITGQAMTNNNTPPTITAFTNMITTDTDGATTQKFSVIDKETPVGVANVTWSSKNQTVMPDGNIAIAALDGTGTNLTLSITPTSGALGVAPILVTVTDGSNDVTTVWLYVTVNPGNQPPTISTLSNTNTLGNITNTYAFTIGDAETPAGNLTLSGFSGNTTLVPNDSDHIFFGGSGTNRTISIASATDQYGVAPITITVNDGAKNTSMTFALQVRPNLVTLLNDNFDYDTGGPIINAANGFWQAHSANIAQLMVGSGAATVTDANGEDVNALLIGQPYSSASKQVLYVSFTVNFSALPTATNSYFAHFKDNTTGGFYGRIYASTADAGPNTYRLGIGNASAASSPAQIAQDLSPGVNYTVVARLVLTNGFSTIWVNPTDESSGGMTDTTGAGAPSPIVSYALRQSSGEGTLTIDNMKVGLNFFTVTTNIVDVPPLAVADSSSVTENTTNNVLSPLVNDTLNTLHGNLSLVSVSPTNGTATISGTNVLFAPTHSFAGTATIGYTITDGFGGTSTSLITVNVAALTPIPISPTLANGKLVLVWGAGFSLQTATNVAGPYVTIPAATSPYTNVIGTNAAAFFRLTD